MLRRAFLVMLAVAVALLLPSYARAERIKVGFPIILSGGGALFGEPALGSVRAESDRSAAMKRRCRPRCRY